MVGVMPRPGDSLHLRCQHVKHGAEGLGAERVLRSEDLADADSCASLSTNGILAHVLRWHKLTCHDEVLTELELTNLSGKQASGCYFAAGYLEKASVEGQLEFLQPGWAQRVGGQKSPVKRDDSWRA